jgi:GDPmannose 4,6-dehydratase
MKVVNAVKNISIGTEECVVLGNLDSQRDWGHAKDYVRGMWLMLQQEVPQDYVLATGETHTIKSFVEKAFLYKGFTISWSGQGVDEIGKDQNGVVRVRVDPKHFRPCEVELLLGDPSKAIKELGWTREFKTLDSLIQEMF